MPALIQSVPLGAKEGTMDWSRGSGRFRVHDGVVPRSAPSRRKPPSTHNEINQIAQTCNKKLAPHAGRVSNFRDLPAAGSHCGFPTDSDAYGSVIPSADFQRDPPSGLRHRVSSGYAVNAGSTSAMLITLGDQA